MKDMRLAPLALGCWAAVLAVLFAGWWSVCLLAVGLVAPHRRWRWIAASALLGVALGLVATGARLPTAHSLAPLVSARSSAGVDLVITDDPRLARAATGRATTWVVPATLLAHGGFDTRVVVLAQDSAWAGLLPGQRVKTSVRFGQSRAGDLTAATLSASGPPVLVGAPPWWQAAAARIRAGLQRACASLPPAPGGLLPGLVVGDTSRLDPELAQRFREVGLTHLVAVSGSNVALIVGSVVGLARWARLSPQWTATVAGVALVGLVILVRPSPSVLRAAVMGGVGLLALASGRGRAALPALCAAIAALLVIDPALATDAGFALSVLATAGLLLLAPPINEALRRWRVPAVAAEALAIPLAAQLACAPVIAGLSATVSLVAVPANLVAVPAIAPATMCGIAAAVLSPVWGTGAQFAAWLGSWPCWWLVKVAQIGSTLPAGAIPWPGGVAGGLLLALVTVVALAGVRSRTARRVTLVLALAGVVGAVPVRLVAPGWPPTGWFFAMCDVGQGDAVVLRSGPHAAIVVDVGPLPAPVASCLGDLGVTEIPLLVLTHYHLDHVGGLSAALAVRPSRILASAFGEPSSGRDAVVRAAAAAGVPISQVPATGQETQWTVGQVTLRVLAVAPLRGTRSDPNNNSIVMLATVSGVRVLLMGDAETEEQGLVRAAYPDLTADVLKVAHHGSSYQDVSLLDEIHPSVALVSVGAGNPYGHPSLSVLDHLRRNGSRVFRTDLDGSIAVALDEGRLQVTRRGRRVLARGRRRSAARPGDVARRDSGRSPRGPCDDGSVGETVVSQSSSPQLTPVMLVLGDEELLVTRAIADTAARARAVDPQAEVRELDASELYPGELAEVLSPSLFGGNRVAVLLNGQDAKKELVSVVLDYVKHPDPDVTLVVTHAGGAKGKAFAESLVKAGATVLPAARLTKHRERVEFVTGEFRRLGGKCGNDAAEALLDAVGNDLRDLAAACAQLTADTDGRIDVATVARYYRGRAEVSGFTVADAAVAGDTAAALEALRWALHTGVDPVPIADALADGVRTVARVASAGRANAFQLASGLGLPAWKIEKAQRQARGWTPDGLVTAMRAAAECNEAVKGGTEDRAYALERTIMLFAKARQGGAR